jgi:hypothetical protein
MLMGYPSGMIPLRIMASFSKMQSVVRIVVPGLVVLGVCTE